MATRTMNRDELTTLAFDYVRAGGRDTTLETAEQILDGARDSMLGREDAPEIEVEACDAEIVRGALVQAVQQAIDEEW